MPYSTLAHSVRALEGPPGGSDSRLVQHRPFGQRGGSCSEFPPQISREDSHRPGARTNSVATIVDSVGTGLYITYVISRPHDRDLQSARHTKQPDYRRTRPRRATEML